jgi:hypothetical protein
MFSIILLLLLVLYELINSLMINKDIREYELNFGKKIVPNEVNIILFDILPILYVIFITTIVVLFVSNRNWFDVINNNSFYVFIGLALIILFFHIYIKESVEKIGNIDIENKLRINGGFTVTIATILIIYYAIKIFRSNRVVYNPYRNIPIPGYGQVERI